MKKVLLAIMIGLMLASCDNSVGFEVMRDLEDIPEPVQNCSVESVEGGALITCPDGSEAFVPNGQDGEDGTDGMDGQDGEDGSDGLDGLFVAYVDPCGSETRHDELLYVDRAGNFHAWFRNVGHVILLEGVNYVTTDGTSCRFRIENGTLILL